MRDAFKNYHPIVNFVYFGIVILFSMFLMHPVFLIISFFASLCYSLCLRGKNSINLNIKFMLPMIILIALSNPLFNHEGMTILTYFPSGNPLTLESILYGIASAFLMICVIQWFYCYNFVMTSDKFIYIFGRIIPSLSLVISMTLRFVPKFKTQYEKVREAQRCIGRDISNGTFMERVKNGIRILSVMVSWSLENGIETADSMKSRGYGLSGRTAFSVYRFEKRDGILLATMILLTGYILTALYLGEMVFNYFPLTEGKIIGIYQITSYIYYFVLCFIPVIIDLKEEINWKLSQSKI